MLKVNREQQGDTLVLRLSGVVDEAVNFDQDLGNTSPDTLVNCKEISRINSLGTKAWVRFFTERSAKGTRFRFTECSPAVVEQLNLFMNFSAGGRVESIYVPFVCTDKKCKKSMVGLFPVGDLRNAGFKVDPVQCKKCGAKAVFDDIPQEYFIFAKRSTS